MSDDPRPTTASPDPDVDTDTNPAASKSITYQFRVPTILWEKWKDTVPRTKTLDTRLRELVKADMMGTCPYPHEIDGWDPETEGGEGGSDDRNPRGSGGENTDADG